MRALLLLPFLLGCPPADAPQNPGPQPASGELPVLTYNVHGFTPSLAQDDPEARMPQIAELLPEFDLVGLQEVWVDEYTDTLAESGHPNRERFDTPLNEERVYGAGLVMFARQEQVDYVETHYLGCNGVLDNASDCLASKGFQFQRIRLADGATVDWYNTHLEAGGGEDDRAVRADQVDLLLSFLAEESAGRAALLTGDLNLHNEADRPDDLLALGRLYDEGGFVDSCAALECADDTHIDRILTRDGGGLSFEATEWEDDPRFYDPAGAPLSDHPAIRATFAWAFEPPE